MKFHISQQAKPVRRGLSCSMLALALAGALSVPSQAQDTSDDVIVVTGSRIATDSALTAASPVQTVTIDSFIKSGDIEIASGLRNVPALQGSDPATLDSAQGFAATGVSSLDLRNLGANRTLVLQDGRRHVAGLEGTAIVDVGTIPQALIARTEVLTGGASSVYGADAVSGVVNFVMRDGSDFDGVEYRLQGGISDKGDAEEFFGSIATGTEFAKGRGNFVVAGEYNHSTSIVNADRPNFAGAGFSSLNNSNAFLNGILGLDPNAEQAFVPNRTLPVSSPGSTIAIDPTPFAFPFGQLLSYVTDFNPTTGTVPLIDGTDIPVLQVIDPVTGEVRAFNPGFSTGAFNAIGGDGIAIAETAPDLTLIPEITRFVGSSAVSLELNDKVEFFADAKYSRVESDSVAGIPFSDDIPIALDNPFLPLAIQNQIPIVDALLPDDTPSIFVARDILGSETNSGTSAERETFRLSGGFRGEVLETGFDYELSYNYGRTDATVTSRNARLNDRYFTAIDAVALTAADLDGTNPNVAFGANGIGTLNAVRNGEDIVINPGSAQVGDIVCRSELTGLPSPAALFVGSPPLFEDGATINGVDVSSLTRPVTFALGDGQCAPVNILGANAIQGAGAGFAFFDLEDETEITQKQLLLTVSGDSADYFELPAGPIGFAVGFEWREEASQFTPAAFSAIDALNVVGNTEDPILPSPIDGQGISVHEVFGELKVPVLADLPFAKSLEVTAAGRVSDYNTIGNTETYSFGGRYQPIDGLTLRGTYSRAIRAPNIGELFGPQVGAFIGVDADPCDDGNITQGSSNRAANCLEFVADGFDSSDFLTAFVTGTTGGNPDLTEETSTSFTLGGVFQPTGALENLVIAVDYYDIEIDDAVGSLTGAGIASACVDLPSTDNQFCDAIERDAGNGGAISGFTSGNINLAFLKARGVDFDVRYGFDAPSIGGRDMGFIQASVVGTHFLERFTESDPIIRETIASIEDPLEQQLLIEDQATVSDLLGVIGTPEWIFNMGLDWEIGKLSANWTGRFEESTSLFSNSARTDVEIVDGAVVVSENVGLADPSQLNTGDSFEMDVSLNYEFSEKLALYGGVANVTDREPFLGSLARPVGPRGRFFFFGVRGEF
ncbi:TonB-dependent receptor domain-containing protein [Litorimonas sp. WD9-15]|uniref:TonB-dependent receptor domain-containing protein n=1 Tax=Litorimonas sp. WD9-15 TaxID=3418716 RepID=UPI003CFDF24D